jgi:hypothetical protein
MMEHIQYIFEFIPAQDKVRATLLLNEGIPRALKRKKLRLKNILLFPLIFEEINYF